MNRIQLYEGESFEDERKYVQGFRTAEESNVGWNPDYGDIYATTSTFRKITRRDKTDAVADLYAAEQRAMMNLDPVTRIRRDIERYLYEFQRANVNLTENDKATILHRFSQAPQKEYKHPLLFVLGYFMERLELADTMKATRLIGQDWVRETDVIRYYRLHQSLH